jgi:hypothetical protein
MADSGGIRVLVLVSTAYMLIIVMLGVAVFAAGG